MVYKLDIKHKKYRSSKTIELVSVELVETDKTACYDYDKGTDWAWAAGKSDWSSQYRMAAYFKTIESRTIYEALSEKNQRELATQLAAEWHRYADYYTMKLKLKRRDTRVHYDLSKSGIVGSGHCRGSLELS